MNQKTIAALIVLIVLLAIGLLVWRPMKIANTSSTSPSLSTNPDIYQPITITGMSECLPHTDTTGPQTMECAFGIKTDGNNLHYAVDLQNLATSTPADFPTGIHMRVTGLFVPQEALNTDMWRKYPIQGIIAVEQVLPL